MCSETIQEFESDFDKLVFDLVVLKEIHCLRINNTNKRIHLFRICTEWKIEGFVDIFTQFS